MTLRRCVVLVAAFCVVSAACDPGRDVSSGRDTAPGTLDEDVGEAGQADDAVATEITAPVASAPAPEPSTSDPSPGVDDAPAPADPIPGMFADDQTTELAVGILLSQSGLGNGQTRPIGFGVGLANRDIQFDGSPFDFGVGGAISAPVTFNDDGDLTEDLDRLRAGIDEVLEAPFTDLFVGAVPPSLVPETTELAAERGIPAVLVNHVDDGSTPQLGVRLDLAGSTGLLHRALVDAVVAAESDGIAIVGPPGHPDTALVEQLFLDAGAAPEIIDAPLSVPTPGSVVEASERLESTGERPAVVLLSPEWAAAVVDVMAPTRVSPSYYSTERVVGRSDVAALVGLGEGELTVVRRVDDLRRPEQADFAVRLFEGQAEGSSTYAAESYDAYALAAIATAASGTADSATIRQAMIEASRGGEPCAVLAECIALAASGVDVDYDGVSGPIDLDDDGVATAVWFSVDVVDPATGGDASTSLVLQRG